MARKRRGNSQGLSPTALKAKRDRDKEMAMTPRRTAMRSQNQSIGQTSTRDIHHVDGVAGKTIYQSISQNRDSSNERNA
jgi:hypothetical protein